ncbi:lipid-A-disaccharide synthase, partial [Suttonella ornithocola]
RLKKFLLSYWQKDKPDIFIGLDAPDFNLRIATNLKRQGIKTVHYVSPSLWAWKEKRITKIKQAIDLMLCLFPFEVDIYTQHQVKAIFVGHPMRDRLQPISQQVARKQIGFERQEAQIPLIGLFPGSRRSEIGRLLPIFLRAMMQMQVRNPDLRAVISISSEAHRQQISEIISSTCPPRQEIILSEKDSAILMSACDVLLLASGTITLEAALLERPSLVAYRVNPLTAKIAKRLLKINQFSLPNLLAGKDIVNEWIQETCTAENLATDAQDLLQNLERRQQQIAAFRQIAASLPNQVSEKAAQAIAELMEK